VGTGVLKKLLAPLVEDVDLKAKEMHVAFAIADGSPRVSVSCASRPRSRIGATFRLSTQ
jgi:hypothetical protein